MKSLPVRNLAPLIGLALALTLNSNTRAQSGTWTNVSGGSWTNVANWLNGIVAGGASSNANFAVRDISGTNTVTLDVARTIGSLTFADTNTTTAGDWLLNTGTGGALTLAVTNGSPTPPTITVTNRTAIIGALVAGTNGYTKAGAGTLFLTNSGNSITGPVLITNGGILELATSGRIGGTGAGSGDITISGGTLQNDDSGNGNYFITPNRAIGIGSANGALSVSTGTAVLLYSNLLSGPGVLTKSGSGELRLYSGTATFYTNTFSKLIISAGTLTIGHSSFPGGDYTYGLIPASFTADALTLQNGATNRTIGSTAITLNTNRGVTLVGGGVFRNDVVSLTIPSVVTGTGWLRHESGTLTLNAANTYTGATTNGSGTLALGVGGSTGTIRNTVFVNTNSILLSQVIDSLGYGAGTCVTNLTILGSLLHQPNGNLSLWGETVTLNGGTLSATNSGASAAIDFGNGTTIATVATNVSATIGGTRVRLRQTTTTFTVPRGTPASDLNVTAPMVIAEVTPAGLTKAGSGIMTLSGASTYNGPTTINAGTLALSGSGSIASSPTLSVASGATFDVAALTSTFTLQATQTLAGSGSVNGNVAALPNATLLPGGAGTLGTLTFNDSLALAGNVLTFDLNPVTNDVLAVGGNMALGGVTQINLNGTPTNNTYTLIRYTGLLAGGPANFQLNSTRAALDFSVPGQIRVVYTGAPLAQTWRGDGSGNRWDIGTSRGWFNGTGLDWFYNGDSVTFDDSSTNLTVTLSGTPSAAAISINSASNYAWSGPFVINSTILKTNSGTLRLTGYTGSTAPAALDWSIDQGTVDFGGSYFNSSPFGYRALAITVNPGGNLRLSASHALGGDNVDGGTSWGQVRVLGGSLEAVGDQYVSGGSVGLEGRLALQGATLFGSGDLRTADAGSTLSILAATTPTTLALGSGVQIRGTLTLDVADGAAASDLIATNGLVVQTTGGLIKTGLGSALLLSTNTYAGATTISAGTLTLGAAATLPSSPTIAIASGATFDVSARSSFALNTNQVLTGSGSVLGSIATTFTNNLTPGSATTAGTLTISGDLDLSNPATLNFNLNSVATPGGNVNDQMVIGGNLTLGGVSTLNVALLTSALDTTTPYRLITYAGSLNGSAANFVLAGLNAFTNRYTFALDFSTANEIRLTVAGTTDSLVWQGTNGNSWDAGLTTNWSNTVSAAAEAFYNLDTVLFDDSSTNPAVVVTGTLLPNAVTVNSASNYTFSGSGKLSGSATLSQLGTGTLTIATTNDFTGAVTVTNGTVKMGNSLALGSTNTPVTVTNGGTLDLGGIVGGTYKPVVVSGAGVGGNGAIVSSAPIPTPFIGLRNVTLAGDTVLGNVATNRWDIGNNVATGGGILAGNGSRLTLVGTNDFSFNGLGDTDLGDVSLNNRTLFLQGNTTLGRTNNTATINPGAGLTLFNATQPQAKALALNGGTLGLGAGAGNWSGPISVAANSSLAPASGLTLTLPGPLSGSANLTALGAGTTVLASSNTFGGDLVLTNGFVTLATNYALGTGRLIFAAGSTNTTRANFSAGVTVTNPIVVSGGTPTSGQGFLTGPASGVATISGPVTFNTGAPAGGHLNGGNATGGLLFSGPITGVGVSQRLNRVTVAGGGSYPSWTFTDTLVLGANDGLATSCLLQPGGSGAGTFDLSGFSQTLVGLAVLNPSFACVVTNSSTNTDSLLTISGGTSTYIGSIKDGPRKIGLAVASGSFTLTNLASTFSGDINVNAGGTLQTAGNNNVNPVVNSPLGAANLATRSLNVNSGGTLNFLLDNPLGNSAAVPALTLAINGGTVANTPTNFATLGPVVFNGGGSLVANGGNSASYQAYSLRGSVTVAGAASATIVASGANSGVHLANPTVFNVLDVTGDASPDLSVSGSLINPPAIPGGSGALVKNGPGSLQLSGVNTYTGNTLINAGTLALASGSLASPLITVVSNATLDVSALGSFTLATGQTLGGNGTVAGYTAAGNGSTLAPGGAGVRGTLSFSSDLALNSGGAASFDLGTDTTPGGGTNDLIVVGNNLALVPGAKIVLAPAPLGAGTYSLINFGGALSGSAADLTLVNSTRTAAGLDTSTPNWLTLIVTNATASANLAWRGGQGGNAWDLITTTNWDSAGAPDVFFQLDNVLFDDVGATNPAVSLTGTLQPTSVSVATASNYLFTGSGKLTGTGGLTKSGNGTLAINAANDFTGAVTLAGGWVTVSNLALNGSASPLGAGTDLVFDGGTLQYTGANVPAATFNRRFLLNAGGGTLDQSSYTNFMFVSNTIAGPGSLTKTGAKQLILGETSGGVPVAGNNTYDGITFINAGEVQMRHPNALGSLVGKTIVNAGGDLAAGGGWTGTVLENLELNGDGPTGGGALVENDTGTAVAFAGNINLASNASIGGSTNLFLSGPIGGPGRLTKVGGNTAILLGANTYSGGTLITNGFLQLDTNSALGSFGSGPIAFTNGGTLVLYRNDTYTLTNSISGPGALQVRCTNGLVVDGSASIAIGGDLSVGQSSYGKLLVQPGASIAVNRFWIGNPGGISGDVLQSGGSVTVGSDMRVGHWGSETSSYLLGAGSLALTNAPAGTVNPSGGTEQPGVLYIGTDGIGLFTMTGGVASATAIVLDGRTDTAGNDTFTLNGGIFTVGTNGILSGNLGANASYILNFGGGTLAANGNWSSPLAMTLTGIGGTASIDATGGAITLSGSLGGPGGLFKSGANTLVLSGNSTFAGPVVVSSGRLSLSHPNGLGSTAAGTTILPGAHIYVLANANTAPIGEALTIGGDGSGNGALRFGSGLAYTLNGPVTLSDDALGFNTDGTSSFTLNGSLTGSGKSVTNQITGAATQTSTINGAISLGSGSFAKTSPGKLVLSNPANTWTGGTFVSGGTLALTGSGVVGGLTVDVASGATLDATGRTDKTFTLASGQTLIGNGRVAGNAIGALGSLIAPGNSIGALTVTSNLTLFGAVAMEIDKGNATNDLITVSNTLTFGGALTVANLSGTLGVGDSFKLFSAASYAGNFTATNLPSLPLGQGWVWDPATAILSIVVTVNPNPTNLVFSVSGDQLTLSWPSDYLGWGLQVQTNDLAVGIATNWVDVPNSTNVTSMSFTIDPANPAVFYRMLLKP